jgi:hypothetical protein
LGGGYIEGRDVRPGKPTKHQNQKSFFFFFSFFFFIWKTFGKTFFGEVDWGKGCSTRLIGPHPEPGLCLEHTLARHSVTSTPSAIICLRACIEASSEPRDLITHQANQTSKPKIICFLFFFGKLLEKRFWGRGWGGGGRGCSTRLKGPRPGAKFLPRTSSNEAFGETNTVRPYG